MNLSDIQFIFNRAWAYTFSRPKLLIAFTVLAACGLMIIFFRAISLNASQWVAMSLAFLPFFLCAGVLLSLGVFLTRVYHDEVKGKSSTYSEILNRSWEVIFGSAYFSVPIILGYLLLWVCLGIFVLLKQIPGVGELFSVIFAFGPFLINLASLLLCVFSLAFLYVVTPILALKGLNRIRVIQTLTRRLKENPFLNIILAVLAILPFVMIITLLIVAAVITGVVCYGCESPVHNILQWFFIMIPFAAILAPAVVFFFNFSAEAHVLIAKNLSRTMKGSGI